MPRRRVSKATQDRYRGRHWGLEGTKVTEWDEPDLPPDLELDEMGQLGEIGTLAGAQPAVMLQFSEQASLVTDDQMRLYCMLTSADRRVMKSNLWKGSGTWALPELAAALGGTQNRRAPYPDIRVQPIGPVSYVIYYTAKGDPTDSAYYEHELGEVSGNRPWLAVDANGRLWWAGGDYTVEDHGIIN